MIIFIKEGKFILLYQIKLGSIINIYKKYEEYKLKINL